MDLIFTLFVIIFTFVLIYLEKIRRSYKFFDKKSIRTPGYKFFFGNYLDIKKYGYSNALQKWTKQYGKTYGYYEGHLPVLVTSDLDMIQQICIKQYSNFSKRRKNLITVKDDDAKDVHLLMASKSRWKRMRIIMNPTFSSSKLRELSKELIKCAKRLIEELDKMKSDTQINIYDYYKRFTMDSIWNSAFGLDINLQQDHENEYLKRSEQIFERPTFLSFQIDLGYYFYEFQQFFFDIFTAFGQFMFYLTRNEKFVHPFVWVTNELSEVVDKRRRNQKNENRKDYVQLLFDAEIKKNDSSISINDELINFNDATIEKKLSFDEIKVNLALFMLAGYETSSTALIYSTFVLIKHPLEQQKLHDEILSTFHEEIIQGNFNPNPENLNKLEYLDMFIKEVLRMYPIANAVFARKCTNPTIINGIEFSLDMDVAFDVMSVHYDAEIWGPVDPYEFHAERFKTKRNPLAFLAFGLGPRNCIGMKFALIELKMALVQLILNFEIYPNENFISTKSELEFREELIRRPKNDQNILVRLKKRNTTSA